MAYRDSVYIDEDRILRIEAEEAVKEVAFAVKSVEISKVLEGSEALVYLNVVTKEQDALCVELTVQGFRVRSFRHLPLLICFLIHILSFRNICINRTTSRVPVNMLIQNV